VYWLGVAAILDAPHLAFCKSVAREVRRAEGRPRLDKILFDVEDCKLFASDFPRKWKRCEYLRPAAVTLIVVLR
jgi:hypothetical protein